MRLLLVSTYGFDPAFPSRPEQIQARALAARGHRVAAYEYFEPRRGLPRRQTLDGGIAVRRCATWGFFSPDVQAALGSTDRPDLIHVHHLRSLLAFHVVRRALRCGIPVVLTPHGLLHDGDLVADRERPLDAPLRLDGPIFTTAELRRRILAGGHPRRLTRNYLIHAPLRQYAGVAALSQHEAGLLELLGVAPERIVVLPNAVDLGAFADEPPPLDARAPLVLFIGQLVHRKAFDLLARAMPLVLAQVPAARFVFVSHNLQGEAELRRIAAETGTADRLEIRSDVDEAAKVALLRSASVVAAPSRYEGFGIPLIEAMAAGTPLVSSDVPACNEIVGHERNGLLAPPEDHAALAAAIVRLFQDRELSGRLVAAGRAEAMARYSAATLAADLERWYARVLA